VKAFDGATVFVVRKGTTPIASSIVLGWRNTMLVPWASALRRYRHLSPNMLLYWSMLEAAVDKGYDEFDFGRSTRDGGTHQFKLQWGATDFPLHWEYLLLAPDTALDQGPTSPKFEALVELWKRLPLWLANVAGPHIVRNIR
jgi:serine/alanine adding enzyme